MTARRALVPAITLLAIVILVWQSRRSAGDGSPAQPAASKAENVSAAAAAKADQKSRISSPPPRLERSTLADALNSPSTDIRADLRCVSEIIESFRTNFLQTGNPTGSNAEITAALTGKNKLLFAFIAPNHPAINRAGELCDRWGTPFFFHAESATKMEIRSAGPDKKMWTDDDAVLSP